LSLLYAVTWHIEVEDNYTALMRSDRCLTDAVVQTEVRRHFNCSSLEGAELEDQGMNGTLLTHWEKRVFEVGCNAL